MKTVYRIILLIAVSTFFTAPVFASGDNGLKHVKSSHDAKTTMEKLVTIVKEKGFTVFAQVDHTAGGKRVGLDLRPTQLLIFGNPKGGTVLMRCNQDVGIDLPLKFLVTTDESGQTRISYNQSTYIRDRHNLGDCGSKVITKVNKVLGMMSNAAAK